MIPIEESFLLIAFDDEDGNRVWRQGRLWIPLEVIEAEIPGGSRVFMLQQTFEEGVIALTQQAGTDQVVASQYVRPS